MSFSNQDRLDLLKAISSIHASILALAKDVPGEKLALREGLLENMNVTNSALNAMLQRLEKDLNA
jgi:hypothetical protein